MKRYIIALVLAALCGISHGQNKAVDVIRTSSGDLSITFIGHGSLLFDFNGKKIYIDPFSKAGDYTTMPKADLVLITHEHQDHLDTAALNAIRTASTIILLTEKCRAALKSGTVIRNGETKKILGLTIAAVPAYNIVHKRDDGNPYHAKGDGNGYVIRFGEKNVYAAGDTENIPEMKNLKSIDIAFLPMNLPYTMTPEMTADAAIMIKPKILYPYHFGESNTGRLVALLKRHTAIEVRLRNMK